MILSILLLIAGLVLILGGANYLVEGASSLAKRWGVSDLVVGLTVVAFGTSAPELCISMLSALNGSAEMAVGNVVGSNIFNVLMIIGATALVRPIKIQPSIMTGEIPFVVLSSVVLLIMGNSPWLDGSAAASITRTDGLLLLTFFAIFMRYTFSQASNSAMPESDPAAKLAAAEPIVSVGRAVVYVIGGLAALIWGGELFVGGASDIAKTLGVSDAVVGLTIVACGTSLPELATSIMAAIKGRPGIAVGNVVGSNIFNIFMVLGATSAVAPLRLGAIGNVDLLVLVAASLLFWIFGWLFGDKIIKRSEGGVMVMCYVAYIVWLVANA